MGVAGTSSYLNSTKAFPSGKGAFFSTIPKPDAKIYFLFPRSGTDPTKIGAIYIRAEEGDQAPVPINIILSS